MDQGPCPVFAQNAPMIEEPVGTQPDRTDLIERIARKLVARRGDEARAEAVSAVQTLIADGNFEMARLWTEVMHASHRIVDSRRRRESSG